MQAIAG